HDGPDHHGRQAQSDRQSRRTDDELVRRVRQELEPTDETRYRPQHGVHAIALGTASRVAPTRAVRRSRSTPWDASCWPHSWCSWPPARRRTLATTATPGRRPAPTSVPGPTCCRCSPTTVVSLRRCWWWTTWSPVR